jgi:glycosyltransferase involved in cell wall biosynthesis
MSRNPLDVQNVFTAPRAIASIVERNGYDLVHVSTPVAGFVTRFALRRLRRAGRPKVIYTAHGFHFHRNGRWLTNSVYLGVERLAGRWTDCLTVMNDDDRHMATHYDLVPTGRLVHIPGVGIDRREYCPEAVTESAVAEVRRELSVQPEHSLLLMIGEFNRNKRHQDVVQAFARVRCPTARFVFAGEGPLMEAMKRLAARLGIGDRVHFLGERRDIAALIRASVATVLPSRREGLPRSVMESLSLGVPVIGSDIRGTRDLLADGCGLLVRIGDIEGFAGAMNWVLEHPDEARAMGRRGLAEMEKYDVSCIVRLHEAVYRDSAAAISV